MRILYVTNAQIPSQQANSIQIIRMCEALAIEGHEVLLLCSGYGSAENIYQHYGISASFKIHFLGREKTGKFFVRLWRLVDILFRNKYDLAYGRYILGMLLCASCGIPTMFEAHALPSSPKRKLAEWLLFRLPAFKCLVTISHSLAADYVKHFPRVDPNCLIVAHDGAKISPGDSLFCQTSGRIQIGYFGSFYPGKGAEIVAVIASALCEYDFYLYGGLVDDIKRLMPSDWIPPQNLHVNGSISPAKVHQCMKKMDILLLPSQPITTIEGQGNIARWMSPLKLFEYMATGRPIVASDLPVFREVLTHGKDALLVTPQDLNSWILAIKTLGNSPTLRMSMATGALERCRLEYSWQARVKKILSKVNQ